MIPDDAQTIIYSILLMKSMKVEISPLTVHSFLCHLGYPNPNEDLIELLIHFWESANKNSEYKRSTQVNPVDTHPAASQDVTTADGRQHTINFPSSGQILPHNHSLLMGRYIYCIIDRPTIDFTIRGIEENQLFTIVFQDLAAVVHACHPEAYQSTDQDQVVAWFQHHQEVLDFATEQCGCVIPMRFDVIIDGTAKNDPDQTVREWMLQRYAAIKNLFGKLVGKSEYGIQISCDSEELLKKIRQEPEITELGEKLESMGKGTAFLYKSELNKKIKTAVSQYCQSLCAEIVGKIGNLSANTVEGPINSGNNAEERQQQIANLSILAVPKQVASIGEILEQYQSQHLTVKFTGPWPPYSFVKELE